VGDWGHQKHIAYWFMVQEQSPDGAAGYTCRQSIRVRAVTLPSMRSMSITKSTKLSRTSEVLGTIPLHNHNDRNEPSTHRLPNPGLACLPARRPALYICYPCHQESVYPWTPLL